MNLRQQKTAGVLHETSAYLQRFSIHEGSGELMNCSSHKIKQDTLKLLQKTEMEVSRTRINVIKKREKPDRT